MLQFRQFHASNGQEWRLFEGPVTVWLPALLLVGALVSLVGSVLVGLPRAGARGAAGDGRTAENGPTTDGDGRTTGD